MQPSTQELDLDPGPHQLSHSQGPTEGSPRGQQGSTGMQLLLHFWHPHPNHGHATVHVDLPGRDLLDLGATQACICTAVQRRLASIDAEQHRVAAWAMAVALEGPAAPLVKLHHAPVNQHPVSDVRVVVVQDGRVLYDRPAALQRHSGTLEMAVEGLCQGLAWLYLMMGQRCEGPVDASPVHAVPLLVVPAAAAWELDRHFDDLVLHERQHRQELQVTPLTRYGAYVRGFRSLLLAMGRVLSPPMSTARWSAGVGTPASTLEMGDVQVLLCFLIQAGMWECAVLAVRGATAAGLSIVGIPGGAAADMLTSTAMRQAVLARQNVQHTVAECNGAGVPSQIYAAEPPLAAGAPVDSGSALPSNSLLPLPSTSEAPCLAEGMELVEELLPAEPSLRRRGANCKGEVADASAGEDGKLSMVSDGGGLRDLGAAAAARVPWHVPWLGFSNRRQEQEFQLLHNERAGNVDWWSSRAAAVLGLSWGLSLLYKHVAGKGAPSWAELGIVPIMFAVWLARGLAPVLYQRHRQTWQILVIAMMASVLTSTCWSEGSQRMCDKYPYWVYYSGLMPPSGLASFRMQLVAFLVQLLPLASGAGGPYGVAYLILPVVWVLRRAYLYDRQLRAGLLLAQRQA